MVANWFSVTACLDEKKIIKLKIFFSIQTYSIIFKTSKRSIRNYPLKYLLIPLKIAAQAFSTLNTNTLNI